ncbi:AEBP2 [Bugula neritina]|uniref:AEBP2 n=1 Tax=Bugula neritina TaxID=10212 RepID=A0A7J7ITN1_BUGNE|nr:AEBP2 [Bugula neritina]
MNANQNIAHCRYSVQRPCPNMAYTSKLRASTRHQVAVVKPVRRGLRKRQPSMRYAEKEYQMVPDEVANYISDRDGETDEEISFSFRNIPSSQSYNCKPKTEGRRATLRQSSIDSSGRLSVLSDESYDSGVGSKSDDDLACLTNSPEKLTSKKPITIEVRSPESSGVIELIDTGDDCFIGYFKPQGSLSTTPTTPTTSATSATSATGGGSSCKVSIQTNSSGRLRRSVSASVSEDSCDSAFHGQKDSSRPSIDLTVLKPKTDTKSKLQTTRKLTHKRKPSKTDLLSSSRAGARSKRDRTVALRRSNRNVLSNRKVRSKQPPPAASSPPSRRTRSRVSTNEPQSPKAKPSPGKSALRRIQHHNRSPERPSESFSSASRHCRTRSHVKSLRNELLTTSPSKPSLRSLNFSTPTKTSADSGLKERKDSADGSISSLKDSDTNGMLNGDRKQDPPVKSACQWRFCKAVVSPADLADHIERLHVASQRRNSKAYKCFWEGCKVYGSVAKSIIWLEGHVKKHLGPRLTTVSFPTARPASPPRSCSSVTSALILTRLRP